MPTEEQMGQRTWDFSTPVSNSSVCLFMQSREPHLSLLSCLIITPKSHFQVSPENKTCVSYLWFHTGWEVRGWVKISWLLKMSEERNGKEELKVKTFSLLASFFFSVVFYQLKTKTITDQQCIDWADWKTQTIPILSILNNINTSD